MSSYTGRQAVMKWGAAGSTATEELGIVEQNEPKIENNLIEGNFRKSRRTNHRTGQQKVTGSVTLEREISDPGYVAFSEAVRDGDTIALYFEPVAGAASDTIDGDFVISNMSKPEPIDGWQKCSFDYALNEDIREIAWD